jgi:hypothetical protein
MEVKLTSQAERILAILSPKTPDAALDQAAKITVDDTVSRFSFLYEKIRNVVDYKDEHLIRKGAILRILRRQLLLETKPEVIADRLIRELISARYLPNGAIVESAIEQVAGLVRKYLAVRKIGAGSERHLSWLLGLVAVEIEECLVDPAEERAFLTFLFDRLKDSIHVRNFNLDEHELHLQIYIACHRALVKADDEMLGYKLLRIYLPEWLSPQEWQEQPRPVAERLVAVERRIKLQLSHVLAHKFLRAVKPWGVSLGILRRVLKNNPERVSEFLEKPEALYRQIEQRAEAGYAEAKTKLRRGTFRAMIYLLLTKMLVAILVELPLEWLWYARVDHFALAVNLSFPPILMFWVGLLIKVPGANNTQRLIDGVKKLLGDEPLNGQEILAPTPRTKAKKFWFTLVYAGAFLVSFGLIGAILSAIDFTWISIVIFVFFLCVVSFFGYRLRLTAREAVVIEGKRRTLAVIADFFFLPILRAGKWLSISISRINIFIFIFDFMFEAPFKMFLAVLEEWFAFMREKKEELQ